MNAASPAGLPTNQDLDPAALRAVFGVFPTGVVAVAAEVEGVLVGLAASSFTSVSLTPPLVSFSVANTSKTWPALRRARGLGVSILSDTHAAVARQLAGPVGSRFTGLQVTVNGRGAATLDDAVAQFETGIHREVEAGDHTIVLLELHAVRHGGEVEPLVFHGSGFRRLAASVAASS